MREGKLKFIICIHNHQPQGNFDQVFVEGFNTTYAPFIEILERFPSVKLTLHYSGSLLSWLKENRPQFIQKLKELVKKGQVRILSSGYYEPILCIIPFEDALAQIKKMNQEIMNTFDIAPSGVWLTERIWEPFLPQLLNKAQIKFTIVDDHHFSLIGMDKESLDGYYLTEFNNYPLFIFAGSQKLRYLIPFREVNFLREYLYSKYQEGKRSICYADDGEKFGMWPGTHKWVYEEKWLERFFKFLEENQEWLQTCFFEEVIEEFNPTSLVYLKFGSYAEMLDWSKGYFRNFFVKYKEANFMHKRMYYVSKIISNLKKENKLSESSLNKAQDFLFRAQANDAYWHGIFGGLYLNHLRFSVYHNLIKAEKIVDAFVKEENPQDINYDGVKEYILKNNHFKIIFSEQGGAMLEWDLRDRELNLLNTLTRIKEEYHNKIFDSQKPESIVQSIHEHRRIKDKDALNYLIYDRYPKYCLVDYLLEQISLEQFKNQDFKEIVNLYPYKYDVMEYSLQAIKFRYKFQDKIFIKHIYIRNRKIFIEYKFLQGFEENYKFCTELNLSVFNEEIGEGIFLDNVKEYVFWDKWFGIRLKFIFDQESALFIAPVFTVSDSEEGIEKNYQHLSFLLSQSYKRDSWSVCIEYE